MLGPDVVAGGNVGATVRRTSSSVMPWATIALAAIASGSLSRPSNRCPGPISALPAARASSWAATTTFLARGVNRPKPCSGSSSAFGTKRCWAACVRLTVQRARNSSTIAANAGAVSSNGTIPSSMTTVSAPPRAAASGTSAG